MLAVQAYVYGAVPLDAVRLTEPVVIPAHNEPVPVALAVNGFGCVMTTGVVIAVLQPEPASVIVAVYDPAGRLFTVYTPPVSATLVEYV